MALARATAGMAARLSAVQAPVAAATPVAARAMLATKAGEVQRPLSPHLTIYRLPLNAMTSIAFRGTGVGMTVGLAAVSLGLAGTGTSILEMTTALHEAGVAPLVRAAVGGALAYHFGHGMRHLMWDQVKGHEIKEVEQGAYALLAGTATATLLAAVVEF